MPASRERFHVYTQRNGLSDHEITSLAEDRTGNLWLGTGNSGAMRVTRGGFTTYGRDDGLEGVQDIFEDRAGELCLKGTVLGDARTSIFEGATVSLLNSHDASLHTRYGTFDGHRFQWFRPAGVRDLGWVLERVTLSARDGDWWLGTGDGLYRFPAAERFSSIRTARGVLYSANDGLAASQVFRLFEDSRGNVWISTTSALTRGLAVWERATGRVRNLTATPGLPSFQDNLPRAFAEDGFGNVWIGLTRGLLRVPAFPAVSPPRHRRFGNRRAVRVIGVEEKEAVQPRARPQAPLVILEEAVDVGRRKSVAFAVVPAAAVGPAAVEPGRGPDPQRAVRVLQDILDEPLIGEGVRQADVDDPQRRAPVGELQPVEILLGADPDRSARALPQDRRRSRMTIPVGRQHRREHRCAFGLEADEPAVGRYPILTGARLQEIVDRRVRQAIVHPEGGERVTVEARQPARGAEPQQPA